LQVGTQDPSLVAPTPTPSGTPNPTVAPASKTGTAKTFRFGPKAISISGSETAVIGTPSVYKISRAGSYAVWPWVGEDQFLKIIFKITDPSGNIEDYNSSDDTYTLNATQVGSYSIFAYALQLGECYNENQCPSVMMTVNAVKTMPTPAPIQSAASLEYSKINNKLNSLRNQLLTFAASMTTIQSQLTSMKNVNRNVNTILENTDSINRALQSATGNTSAQPNVGNQEPNVGNQDVGNPEPNEGNQPPNTDYQAGGNRRRTRRNKLKRTSKLRKTRSKV
jgi:hypothetical protein